MPSSGWHVFSTHDVPWRIVRPCLVRNAQLVDRTFVWVNNPVCRETLVHLSDHPAVSGLLLTREPAMSTLPIYDLPTQVGEMWRSWLFKRRRPARPAWVSFHDDDDMWPVASGFPAYFQEWIESDSRLMLMRQLYLWGHPNVARIDNFRTVGWHARFAKVPRDGISWTPIQTRCRPHVDESQIWCCPWPLLHFTVFDREMRQRYHDRRAANTPGGVKGDGTDARYHVDVPDAHLIRYDREMTCVEYVEILRAADRGSYPDGVWLEGDGSWVKDFEDEVPYYDKEVSSPCEAAATD